MSSTPLDLPILISQLPYVQKIAHAEKAKPEIRKLLFGPLITEHLRKNEEKVQHIEKKEKAIPVDRDGHQKEQQASSERKEKKEDDDPDTGSSNTSPWSGNIVNVKI
jgi:hypothetical protein